MMGTVETQSMTQSDVSSPLSESTKVVGLEKEKIELNEVLTSVGDQVVETRVSVLKENVSEVMVDSDKKNEESSLFGMRGSDLNIRFEEKLDCEGEVVEAAVLNGDGLIGVDVKETGEEKKDENSDEKIVNLEFPIVERSDKEKKDENCDGKIVNLEIPIVVDTSKEEKKDESSDGKIVNLEIPIIIEKSVEEKKDEDSDGKIATLDVPIVDTSVEVKKDESSDGKIVTLEVPIAKTTEEEKKGGNSDGKIVTLEVPIAETNEEEKNDESSDGNIVTLEVPIMETSEEMNVEVEDMSAERYGFSVGDFVWGKIKNHPWWPGRVYDPSDASDLALKLKQKNRLLVAYFGDGTFAWCHPSQLKPFEDNFDDKVRQSSSKAFNNAVQEAVNEVGKLLDMKMSRSFVARETTFVFDDLPLAKNSGIKEGVRVPESGIEKFSAVVIEPVGLLSQVKQIAETLDIASILELEILKTRLLVFYLSRGGYRLAYYEDPQTVVGLEDMSPDEAVDEGNGKSLVEAPGKGPFEEDCSTPLSSLKSGGPLSGSRSNRSRKQKSIAEIMGEDEDVVPTKDKKRDASDEVVNATGSEGSEDAVASKPVRKRKESRLNTDDENEGQGGEENGESRKGTDEGKSKEQHEKDSLRRERKKSKYLSPPFTTSIRELVKGKIETENGDGGLISPRALKRKGEASQERELSNSSKRRTKHDEKKTIDPEALQVASGKVLSDVRDAAISPQFRRETDSLDGFADFILVLRSSLFVEGSLYEVYNKHQSEKKRKKPESDHEMPGKDQNESDHISANEDSKPTKKKEKTPRIPKEKKSSETKTINKGANEKPSAALLFVSFGPGSSALPTKSDLITIFSKFGALNEEETEMFRTNYTARVSFLKASDAENALNQSEKVNPFESANVTYELKYVSDDGSKSKSSQKKKKVKTPTTTSATLQQCTNEASKLNFIKHELEGLNTMLESSDGKSPDFKTKIESKVKSLLEDVNKMVESNSA